MVRPGSAYQSQVKASDVAKSTFTVLQRAVPISIGGIFFLSGGMTEQDATECLNEINKIAMVKWGGIKPWHLSFSFGRALQKSCLAAWNGKDEPKSIKKAQDVLYEKAKSNSLATLGNYHRNGELKEESKMG